MFLVCRKARKLFFAKSAKSQVNEVSDLLKSAKMFSGKNSKKSHPSNSMSFSDNFFSQSQQKVKSTKCQIC